MNTSLREAVVLTGEVRRRLRSLRGVEVVLCPPTVYLPVVKEALGTSGIGLGAQNSCWESKGAFTGETSSRMLAEFCDYVIVGHSERRTLFGETDESVRKKAKACLDTGLVPIICVGENLSQYEDGKTNHVIRSQVEKAFEGLSPAEAEATVVAYEPVWAIGTGKAADGAAANSVAGLAIRGTLAGLYGESAARSIRIQYGGSVTSANAVEFLAQPEIDGALIGGASLDAGEFVDVAFCAAGSGRGRRRPVFHV